MADLRRPTLAKKPDQLYVDSMAQQEAPPLAATTPTPPVPGTRRPTSRKRSPYQVGMNVRIAQDVAEAIDAAVAAGGHTVTKASVVDAALRQGLGLAPLD